MDREAILVNNKENGHRVCLHPPGNQFLLTFCQYAFDNLGQEIAEDMTLGKFGADARSYKYNLFREITQEQLGSYLPSQLITMLEQRDHVRLSPCGENQQIY